MAKSSPHGSFLKLVLDDSQPLHTHISPWDLGGGNITARLLGTGAEMSVALNRDTLPRLSKSARRITENNHRVFTVDLGCTVPVRLNGHRPTELALSGVKQGEGDHIVFVSLIGDIGTRFKKNTFGGVQFMECCLNGTQHSRPMIIAAISFASADPEHSVAVIEVYDMKGELQRVVLVTPTHFANVPMTSAELKPAWNPTALKHMLERRGVAI